MGTSGRGAGAVVVEAAVESDGAAGASVAAGGAAGVADPWRLPDGVVDMAVRSVTFGG
jgi:hypothetical protein